MREFVEGGSAKEATELRDAGVIRDHVAIGTVFFNKVGFTHFLEGFFGRDATIFGLHGTEFIDSETAVEAREAGFGVDRRSRGVSEFLDEPDDAHGDEGDDKEDATEDNIANALSDFGTANERGDTDEDSGGATNELKLTHLRS